MAGLMTNSGLNTKKKNILGVDMYGATATGYDPALREIDASKETVQGQLRGILSSGSPLLTAAQTNARQEANRRGLMNTSIATGAGTKAMIDTATPIAAADADIYGTASRENTAARNRAFEFTAGAMNTAGLHNSQQFNVIPTTKFAAEQDRITREGQYAHERGMAELGAQLETGLIGARGAVEASLIGTRGAEERLTQEAAGNIQARIAQLQAALETGLIGERGAQERLTSAQAQQAQRELTQLQAALETGLIGARGEQERLSQLNLGQIQASLAELDAQLRSGLIDQEQAGRVELQLLQAQSAKELGDLEAQYKVVMQTSASAGQLMTTAQQTIADLFRDTGLNGEAKAAAAAQIYNALRAQLGVLGSMANLDLIGTLEFPEGTTGSTGTEAGAASTGNTGATGLIDRLKDSFQQYQSGAFRR